MVDWRRFRRTLSPKRMIGPDVDEEIRFHIEGRVRELVSDGWTEERARVEVMRRFGDVSEVEAACHRYSNQRVEREEWRMMFELAMQELKLALKSLSKSPSFSLTVILTLAVGIGSTTAIFSVVNGVLLRPLPYDDPNELAIIWQNDRATGTIREFAATADYYDFKERSRSFSDMAMYASGTVNLTQDAGEPRRLSTATVTSNLASLLGVAPQLGRMISAEEDEPGGPSVVLLSDAFWKLFFSGDPRALGSTITLNGAPSTVIGVLPAGLDFPTKNTELWIPIQQSQASSARNPHFVTVIGRLAQGVTVSQAHAEMTGIAADLEAEFSANRDRGAFVESVNDVWRGNIRQTLWVLFGAVFTVLLIACANVANLLLARGASRVREMAVCAALGAGSRRLFWRFLAESLLLTGTAAAGGVALAVMGVRALTVITPAELLSVGDIGLDWTVLGFTLTVSVVLAMGFGLLPALQARRVDLQSALKEGRSGGDAGTLSKLTVRRLLVAGQMAMAVMLLISAGLLISTLWNLQRVDPGFRAAGVLRADYQLSSASYPRDFAVWPDWPEVNGFNAELIRRAEALPGVQSAAVVLNHPLQAGFTNSVGIEGRAFDSSLGEITTRIVTPGYFETAGLRLVTGRLLDPNGGPSDPWQVVINETGAAHYFPEGDAIGSRMTFWGPELWREVVGIVEDEKMFGLSTAPPPALYANMYQAPPRASTITLMVRTSGDPRQLIGPVRETVWSLDGDLAVYNVSTMEETVAEAVATERFASTILAVFALVAVFLAVLGVHGVLSYLVAQRSHEVGVRMALGATRRDVLKLIVSQGMTITVLGLAAGTLGALATSKLLEGLLFGVSPTEPATYVAVVTVLGAAAALACALPANRAARIHPTAALRGD